jgi:hypothetical protein
MYSSRIPFRSIHNTRVERMWYDVTRGWGHKWKNFFLDLEHNHDLNPFNFAHLWLLHFLFHAAINYDAQKSAAYWNSHTITLPRGQQSRRPDNMFFFGTLENGARGLERIQEPVEDALEPDQVNSYGIDWAAVEDDTLRERVLRRDTEAYVARNPFQNSALPSHMNAVACKAPNCPFTPEGTDFFSRTLVLRCDTLMQGKDFASRRSLWIAALAISSEICNNMGEFIRAWAHSCQIY